MLLLKALFSVSLNQIFRVYFLLKLRFYGFKALAMVVGQRKMKRQPIHSYRIRCIRNENSRYFMRPRKYYETGKIKKIFIFYNCFDNRLKQSTLRLEFNHI